MVEDFTFLLRESRPLQEDAKSPENWKLIYFIIQSLYLFKSKVCLDDKAHFWQQIVKNPSYLPILHLTTYPSLLKQNLKAWKVLFVVFFFQIQKTHFNILPMDAAVWVIEQKM